ncbi:Clr5 domain-containing protein [Microdochium trichocladiopsis]|uniref:Clr5 domain-containing protein n=1 Tax=Microdochium trichocladiopsis TaxID=1682393 RepID=A0A9P9BW74_9PEZI|nr:Clr5 domain-containing protein [Microdochium trichocladiopsis]KAH7040320.1 Clr5 domain-containing protein [Microdochium trichocladiopsis]
MTKSWDTYRSIIVDLYADRTLAEVRQIMQRDYGFDASTRAYRGRLIRWGVRKYNTRRADGSVSGDEDGDGASSLSDADSPLSARQHRGREHGFHSPTQQQQQQQQQQYHHRSQSDSHARDRDGFQNSTLYSNHSPLYSSGYNDDDDIQPPYLYTSGYPQVSRSSPAEGYSIWSAPDDSPFSPDHSQAPGQVSYSAPYYSSHGSPDYSSYDSGFYASPHSAGPAGYDTTAFPSFGSVDDGHGSDYSPQHYRQPSEGNMSHQPQYAAYPASARHHGQPTESSRRGHRDRGRG